MGGEFRSHTPASYTDAIFGTIVGQIGSRIDKFETF